jgi:hypothetical protein
MRDDERDLPEGVIDANPAGGWEDGQKADGETQESSAGQGPQHLHNPAVSDGWGPDIPPAADRRKYASGVESDVPSQGADPDMATDADAEEK